MYESLLPKLNGLLSRYRDEEVIHALPLVLLPALGGLDDARALGFLADFLAIAGVVSGDGPPEAHAKAQLFYDRFPPNAALITEIEDFVKANLGDGADARAKLALALGEASATGVLGGGGRPEGSAPGGILSRIAAASFVPPPEFKFDPTSTAER